MRQVGMSQHYRVFRTIGYFMDTYSSCCLMSLAMISPADIQAAELVFSDDRASARVPVGVLLPLICVRRFMRPAMHPASCRL